MMLSMLTWSSSFIKAQYFVHKTPTSIDTGYLETLNKIILFTKF